MLHKTRIKFLETAEEKIWKGHALHFGASIRKPSGIEVVCKFKDHPLVKDSLSLVEEFDSNLWKQLVDSIKMIVFVKEGECKIIPGKGIVTVLETDQSHTSTPIHLASWLVYYTIKLQGVKDVGIVSWYKSWNEEVESHAKEQRKRFLSGGN